jgi:hypothetical protein
MPASEIRLRDVLLTFQNGERSGVKEIAIQLGAAQAECGGPGTETLRRVLDDRPGGIVHQVFHLEYDNTRLRECTALPSDAGGALTLAFESQEPIDDY